MPRAAALDERPAPPSASADGGAHLPQPAWFGDVAVDVQDHDHDSTLSLYRRALSLRDDLQGDEVLEWVAARAGDAGADDRAIPAPRRLGGRDELRDGAERAASR